MSKVQSKPAVRAVLAANVRRLRTELDLSQEQLGEDAGFHRTYVSQVERSVANITIDNVEKLALRLGVQPHQLLEPIERAPDSSGSARS